jgi:hypothetical protein
LEVVGIEKMKEHNQTSKNNIDYRDSLAFIIKIIIALKSKEEIRKLYENYCTGNNYDK